MAIPKSKEELLHEIATGYSRLKEDLIDVPAKQVFLKELEGHSKGTLMSVHDLVAYLTGWGELVLKWHSRKSKGLPVDFPETGFKWNELGKLAQKFYADHEDLEYEALLKKLDKTVKQLQALVEKHSNAALYKTAWYEKYTMGRMIQLNTSSPYKNARLRLRKWKKRKGLD